MQRKSIACTGGRGVRAFGHRASVRTVSGTPYASEERIKGSMRVRRVSGIKRSLDPVAQEREDMELMIRALKKKA